MLNAHLLAQGSGTLLRVRVKEASRDMREPDPTETEMVAMSKGEYSDPIQLLFRLAILRRIILHYFERLAYYLALCSTKNQQT
jgi:hypothetical protein